MNSKIQINNNLLLMFIFCGLHIDAGVQATREMVVNAPPISINRDLIDEKLANILISQAPEQI